MKEKSTRKDGSSNVQTRLEGFMSKEKGQVITQDAEMRVCALEGCSNEFPVLSGRRPRLYCSDAHRYEAHRRSRNSPPDPQTIFSQAISLLSQGTRINVEESKARLELAERLAASEREKLEALKELDKLVAENAELQARIEDLEDALAVSKAEVAEAHERIEVVGQEMTERLRAQEAKYEDQLATVAEMRASEQEAWQQEREGLLAKLNEVYAENGTLKEALAHEERRRGELTQVLQEKEEDIATLRAGVERAIQDVSTKGDELQEAQQKIEAQAWEISALCGERDYLRAELQNARLTSEGLQAQVRELKEVIEGLRDQFGKIKVVQVGVQRSRSEKGQK
jgi:chromosome segregation ATPase